MVRMAIARAVEEHAAITADRAEWARRVEGRDAVSPTERAELLLHRWHQLAPRAAAAGLEYAVGAQRAAATLEAGQLAEIEVFAAYLDAISDAHAEDEEREQGAAQAKERAADADRRAAEAKDAEERRVVAAQAAVAAAEAVARRLASELGAAPGAAVEQEHGRLASAREGLRAAQDRAATWLDARSMVGPGGWLDEGRRRLANLEWWRARVTAPDQRAAVPVDERRGGVEEARARAAALARALKDNGGDVRAALAAVRALGNEGERPAAEAPAGSVAGSTSA